MATDYTISANLSLGPIFGELSVRGLASLLDVANPANEIIDGECSQKCGARYEVKRFWQSLTCCENCRAKAERENRLEQAKAHWESICPKSFRNTDKEHAGFPKAQYEQTKDYLGERSLLLLGDTGTGKTRLAMLLLKRCLVKCNKHVGVMWDLDVQQAAKSFDPKEAVQKWGRYDVLLMDDCLLSGGQNEKVTTFLKSLLDFRQMHEKHVIITSQITAQDYNEQVTKFDEGGRGKATESDKKRVEALLRRIKEMCGQPIAFTQAKPQDGEEAF